MLFYAHVLHLTTLEIYQKHITNAAKSHLWRFREIFKGPAKVVQPVPGNTISAGIMLEVLCGFRIYASFWKFCVL